MWNWSPPDVRELPEPHPNRSADVALRDGGGGGAVPRLSESTPERSEEARQPQLSTELLHAWPQESG